MDNKKKILWISPYAPYDKVAHGGGKTHNFYIKYFQLSNNFDITLLSLCLFSEKDKLDLDKYGIKNNVFIMDKTKHEEIIRRIISGISYANPFDLYGGTCLNYERFQMKRMIHQYECSSEQPEIIILQWTFSLMFLKEIKRKFPNSKIIAIEEDVTFLNYERKKTGEQSVVSRFFWKQRYNIMKEKELTALQQVNLIVTNNPKDTKLLEDNSISQEKIFTSAPFIEDYSFVKREKISKKIIFLGAMSRPENYNSAIWFVEHVMPLIKDKDIEFWIIGGNPHAELLRLRDPRVVVTGYVENIASYFEECLCMVVPLIGGAGIKIKVLEAMSAGVPVLTNEIGIEGIPAVSGKEYLFCNKPEEYADYINKMGNRHFSTGLISENAKKFVQNNYNLSLKLDQLIDIL